MHVLSTVAKELGIIRVLRCRTMAHLPEQGVRGSQAVLQSSHCNLLLYLEVPAFKEPSGQAVPMIPAMWGKYSGS